jgi:hypothetical protein
MIETDLRDLLLADTTVSGLAGTRIYLNKLPQDPGYPAITFAKVSGPRVHTLAGRAGRARPRLTVHCWAKTDLAVKTLANAVRVVLDGFNGPTASGRTTFLIDNEFDTYEDDADVHRVVQDYRASHRES